MTLVGSVAMVAALGFGVSGPLRAADGSGVNNPQLLRGSIDASCVDGLACNFGHTLRGQATPVASKPTKTPALDCNAVDPYGLQQIGCPSPDYDTVFKQNAADTPVARQSAVMREARPEVVDAPAPYRQDYPAEPVQFPGLEADWRVTLRGAYNSGSNGQRFGIAILPEASVTRQLNAGKVILSANANVSKEGDGVFRLSSGTLDFAGEHMLNRHTGISGGASVSIDQASPYDLDADAGIAAQPLVVNGSANVAINRQSGRFGFEGRGEIERVVYGETQLTSGGTGLNGDRNRLSVTGAGRVSYALSGRTGVFAEAAAERSLYDMASASTGVALNSWTYTVRAGVTGNWDNVVVAEFSAGYGLRRFDSALLSDAPAALVNAKLTYRPNAPVELSALFGTEFSAPASSTGATAQIDYSASSVARYLINDRTAVRANIGGTWSRYSDTTDQSAVYTAGVGADFNLNMHTVLSADYEYGLRDSTGSSLRHNHMVSVGMTYSR